MTVICNVAVHVLAALLALPGAKMSLTLSIRNSITMSIRRLTGIKVRTVARNAATDSLTALAERCNEQQPASPTVKGCYAHAAECRR